MKGLIGLIIIALLFSGCAMQFDPFNNQGSPKTSPDVIKAIEALNAFAQSVDTRLKKLEPKQ